MRGKLEGMGVDEYAARNIPAYAGKTVIGFAAHAN